MPEELYRSSQRVIHETTCVTVILEWIVHGSRAVEVEVDFQRGGVHRCAVRVGAEAKL